MTRPQEDVFEDFACEFIRNHRASRPVWRIDRVLVSTDFSVSSLAALDHAADLARAVGAELSVLHVEELPLTPSDLVDITRGTAERAAARIAEHLRSADIRARALVRAGVPVLEILDVAKEEHAALIVVGTHGHKGLQRVLMGGVAEALVRAAPCPVLTVRSAHRG